MWGFEYWRGFVIAVYELRPSVKETPCSIERVQDVEYVIWKEGERKWSRPTVRYYFGILSEYSDETTKCPQIIIYMFVSNFERDISNSRPREPKSLCEDEVALRYRKFQETRSCLVLIGRSWLKLYP